VPAPPELYPTFARVPRSAPRPSTVAIPLNATATSEVFNSKEMVIR